MYVRHTQLYPRDHMSCTWGHYVMSLIGRHPYAREAYKQLIQGFKRTYTADDKATCLPSLVFLFTSTDNRTCDVSDTCRHKQLTVSSRQKHSASSTISLVENIVLDKVVFVYSNDVNLRILFIIFSHTFVNILKLFKQFSKFSI